MVVCMERKMHHKTGGPQAKFGIGTRWRRVPTPFCCCTKVAFTPSLYYDAISSAFKPPDGQRRHTRLARLGRCSSEVPTAAQHKMKEITFAGKKRGSNAHTLPHTFDSLASPLSSALASLRRTLRRCPVPLMTMLRTLQTLRTLLPCHPAQHGCEAAEMHQEPLAPNSPPWAPVCSCKCYHVSRDVGRGCRPCT